MPTSTRRLAAIMFTDIVGYTALMGSDEDRAFEILHKNREIHAALVEKHDGTLIKEMGDGMLISFNQASEAVGCAIDIQQKATEELNSKNISDTAECMEYYFESNELKSFFCDFNIHYYYEGIEQDLSHGQPHDHGWACLLASKP
jgi:hypothetical protein